MSLQMVVVRLSFGGVHSWLSFGCHSVGGSQLVVVRLSFSGGSQLVVVRLSFGGGSQLVVVRLSFGGGGHSWLSFGCHSVGGSQLVVVRLSFGRGVTAGCRSVVIRWGDVV